MKMDLSTYLRLFLLILLSGAFVIGTTKIGTNAYETVFAPEEVFSAGTSIGSVSVEGLSPEEAQNKLVQAVTEWKQTSQINLTYSDQIINIPTEKIEFFIAESVTGAIKGVLNPLLVDFSENNIQAMLAQFASEEIISALDMEGLSKEMETQTGALNNQEISVSLSSFLRPDSRMSQQVLASTEIEAEDITDLTEAITLTISPYATFSFLNDFAAKYPDWTDEMLTKAASALYEASLQTNLQIVERQISTERPAEIKTGFEARVKRDEVDLVLKNPNDFELVLTFQEKADGQLSVEIIGYPLVNSYEIYLENEKTYEYRKIVQYSAFVKEGSETVKQAGSNGSSVTVYRDVFSPNGGKIEREKISDDFYLPVNQIVLRPMVSSTDLIETTNENGTATENVGDGENLTDDEQKTQETKTENQGE